MNAFVLSCFLTIWSSCFVGRFSYILTMIQTQTNSRKGLCSCVALAMVTIVNDLTYCCCRYASRPNNGRWWNLPMANVWKKSSRTSDWTARNSSFRKKHVGKCKFRTPSWRNVNAGNFNFPSLTTSEWFKSSDSFFNIPNEPCFCDQQHGSFQWIKLVRYPAPQPNQCHHWSLP